MSVTVSSNDAPEAIGCEPTALGSPVCEATVETPCVATPSCAARGEEDTLVNTPSAVLLTVGFFCVVRFALIELVGRLRNRS